MDEFNRFGEEIERLLLLRTAPIAVKLLEREEEIPEGAVRPRREMRPDFPRPDFYKKLFGLCGLDVEE